MSDTALVHRLAYDIEEPLLAVQVDTQVRFLDRPTGHFFFLVARQKASLCLEKYWGLAGVECEDGSPKTQATVMFSAKPTAVPVCTRSFEIFSP